MQSLGSPWQSWFYVLLREMLWSLGVKLNHFLDLVKDL